MIKIYIASILVLQLAACSTKNWREASRESVKIAPLAADLKDDIYLIYYARAFSWRGYFGVHPWVAWKLKGENEYTVAQVTAWGIQRTGNAVTAEQDLPDRKWFDSSPSLLFELRGDKAKRAAEKTKDLIKTYPYKDLYRVWPGPNSNTFVAYLIRNIDELDIELPAHAVGKDYLGNSQFFAKSPSGTGFQASAFGVLGLTMGLGEGLEINLLGIHLGIDLWTPALKLPFVGRVGFSDKSLD